MKEIILTNSNKIALVDVEYWLEFALQDWCIDTHGYARTTKGGIYLHKIITKRIGIENPDHIDRNRLNNVKTNFREATKSQNQANRGKKNNTSSKYKGVSWNSADKKWVAQIRVLNKLIYLGFYDFEAIAALAYNEAAIKYFNKFAVLNEIEDVWKIQNTKKNG